MRVLINLNRSLTKSAPISSRVSEVFGRSSRGSHVPSIPVVSLPAPPLFLARLVSSILKP